MNSLTIYQESPDVLFPSTCRLLFKVVGTVKKYFCYTTRGLKEVNKLSVSPQYFELSVLPIILPGNKKKYLFLLRPKRGETDPMWSSIDYKDIAHLMTENSYIFRVMGVPKLELNSHDLDALRCYSLEQDLYEAECLSLLIYFRELIIERGSLASYNGKPFIISDIIQNLRKKDLFVLTSCGKYMAPFYFVMLNLDLFSFSNLVDTRGINSRLLGSRIGLAHKLELKCSYLQELFRNELQSGVMSNLFYLLAKLLPFKIEDYKNPADVLELRTIMNLCDVMQRVMTWIEYATHRCDGTALPFKSGSPNSDWSFLSEIYQDVLFECQFIKSNPG